LDSAKLLGDCRYIVKPSTGKDFVETVLDVEADVKNETGYVYYKLYKVCCPHGSPCWDARGPRQTAHKLHEKPASATLDTATACSAIA